VWVAGSVIVLVGLIALVLMLRKFSSQSYLYLMFYAIPANAAISVFPHEPVLIYFGGLGSVWKAAAAATVGTLGAGILDHTLFVPVLNLSSIQGYKEKRWYRKAVRYFMRYPFLTLLVTAFTPIPFFPFKFLTFSIQYPLWKYLSALLLARFPRYVLLASVGKVLHIPNWLLFGFFVAVTLIYAAKGIPSLVRHLRARDVPERG